MIELSALKGPLLVLSAIVLATTIEALVPLRTQSRFARRRLRTNLGLIALTLTLGLLLNGTLVAGAGYVSSHGLGLFPALGIKGIVAFALTFVALDFTTYLAHVLLHKVPVLWRVHLLHHTDVAVDATTGFRQHPIEGALRFAFAATTAWSLGAPIEAVAVYRTLSALNSAFEHANIRVPALLDRILVCFWVTPHMHKVHHSREPAQTDSNYANLFSFFDRLFGTFTPSERATSVQYGIHGYDTDEYHSFGAALCLPFLRKQSSVERSPMTL